MSRALVLNATFEPLCVVPARRAACLVLADKADVLEHDGTAMHSERLTIHTPSVIRLRYVVKVPYHRRTALSRRAVFARDAHRCQYCGIVADSIDHVMPRSRGGPHTWENVVAACRPCNVRKRDRTPEEAHMRLAKRPIAPRELAWIVVAVGHVPSAWEPYLTTSVMGAMAVPEPLSA
jgi:5-methylcytosine-specific restriction endonuclease McrA